MRSLWVRGADDCALTQPAITNPATTMAAAVFHLIGIGPRLNDDKATCALEEVPHNAGLMRH
jgi:hypothetical protein